MTKSEMQVVVSPLNSKLSSSNAVLFPSNTVLSTTFLVVLADAYSGERLSDFASNELSSVSVQEIV